MLADVLKDAVHLAAIPEGIVLECSLPRELPLVKASPSDLNEVFVELFTNAVTAMEERPAKKLTITACLCDDGRSVETKVKDSGRGIEPAHLHLVWIFGWTTNPERGGTGYGLYRCAQQLRKIGATIHVDSRLNVGTEFTIRIPLWEDGHHVTY